MTVPLVVLEPHWLLLQDWATSSSLLSFEAGLNQLNGSLAASQNIPHRTPWSSLLQLQPALSARAEIATCACASQASEHAAPAATHLWHGRQRG